MAITRLPVRELPSVEAAEVSVRVNYTGAAPDVVDNQLATVIEGALAGVSGVTAMRTSSDRGRMRSADISIRDATSTAPPTTCAPPSNGC